MDDFDVSGSAAAAPALPALTDISIAYALFTYFAFAFLAIGLAIQMVRVLRQMKQAPAREQTGSFVGRLFRAATDILLLRTTFFADRWAWIFGAAFYFGLILILIRHLRYFLQPAWLGPLWPLLVLEQPFGFYGGLILPFACAAWWGRQTVLKEGRIITSWADHAVMLLLVAIPVVGYFNSVVHTDVIAVKAYATGLVTFNWSNIPTDPLLLIHLWLVAALMIVIPFSRLLLILPFGRLLQMTPTEHAGNKRRRKLILRTLGPVLVVILLAPVAVVARHGMTQGFRPAPVDMTSLVVDHRTDDDTVMIRNHPKFLFSHRTAVLHAGVVTPGNNIERCVTCHAVKDASGQPVGIDDPTHFCRGCHIKAAVTIDCFECHQSKPTPQGQAMLLPRDRFPAVVHQQAERTAAR